MIPVITSFVVVLLATPLIRKTAFRLNILDIPNRRKPHKQPVPLLGGLAITAGLLTGFLLDKSCFSYFYALTAGGGIILIIGLIDDIRGLSCKIRIAGQLAASLLIIHSGSRIDLLPDGMLYSIIEITVTVVWIVGITNALNYLDGLDGLAASITAVSSLCFGAIAYISGQYYIFMLSLIITASCMGFIPHNFRKKKIFLGDAGSTLMGFVLACMAVMGNWANDYTAGISVPLLILGVPIFDMTFTTVMRIKDKKVSTVTEWLKYAGKDHFHHRLIDLGLGSIGSVIFINCITVFFGVYAIIISQSHTALNGIQAMIQAVIIYGAIGVFMVQGAKKHPGSWKITD